ncbi:hypothetical protein ABIF97_004143 [Bradyrhizobium japonicum]
MTKPAHAFRIARIERLRELLEGSNFGIPRDPNTSENPTRLEATTYAEVLGLGLALVPPDRKGSSTTPKCPGR